MTSTPQVLEHGSTRPGRWLREHRLRVALWIAVAEGLLTIVGVIPKYLVFLLALVALALWWFVGRRHRHDTARHATWIFATSQLLVVLVPAAIVILGTVAVVVISLIAVAALVVLFTERS